MSTISKLFRHSSNYFWGQALLMVAGFASFPLLTRLLSVEDFGLLGLVTTTIMIIVSLSKMGLQNSVVRFYSVFHSGGPEPFKGQYYSTFVISAIVLGGSASVIFLVILQTLPQNMMGGDIKVLLEIAAGLILFNCSLQTFAQIFRAEQRPKMYVLLSVSSRYGSLLLGILFYFAFGRHLFDMIAGSVLWEGAAFAVFAWMLVKKREIKVSNFSTKLFKDSLRYGLPLIGSEMSFLMLNFGDRYIIQYYLGAASLGIYSAGCGIATYAAELLTLPIRDAIFPIYMDIYGKKGEEDAKLFLGGSLRYFSLIAIPIVFGLSAVSGELIVLLASKKYLASGAVVPYVISAFMIYGSWNFFGAGLFIYKKTFTIMVLMLLSCVLNLMLNLFLIPKWNIIGAALSIVISFSFYIILLIFYSFRLLSFKIDYRHILVYLGISVGMYFIITSIHAGNLLVSLCTKILVGIIFYSFFVIIFDKEIRIKLENWMQRLIMDGKLRNIQWIKSKLID